MNKAIQTKVWVFSGADSAARRRSEFPSAVFSTFEHATRAIGQYRLTGTLTSFVLDEFAIHRSARLGLLSERDETRIDELVQVWSGGEEHAHFEAGRLTSPPATID